MLEEHPEKERKQTTPPPQAAGYQNLYAEVMPQRRWINPEKKWRVSPVMKFVLYDILLHISIVILFPYFIFKMVSARKYREGIPERFGFIKNEKLGLSGRVIWVHAVSVGETKAIMPVLKLFRERNPDVKIVFSTVTQTGNRTAEADGKGIIDTLIYFPFDLGWVIRRVVRLINPKAFVVVEKEIWPNVFRILNENKIPIIVANGTISERSFKRFVKFRFFFGGIFRMISFFSARTEEDCRRAIGAGVPKERAKATGNIKFDLKPPKVDTAYIASLEMALNIRPGDRVFVAGSTHAGEEEIILNAYKAASKEIAGLKLIIAPRHPERFAEVEALLKKTGVPFSKRSKSGKGEVILLDTVGELMMVYSFAKAAFVGGSIVPGIGGHNLLEPAFFGKPVLYGPYLTTYFNMAEMLEAEGGGIRVKDETALVGALKNLFNNETVRKNAGDAAKKVVEENGGAAKRTVEIMEKFLR